VVVVGFWVLTSMDASNANSRSKVPVLLITYNVLSINVGATSHARSWPNSLLRFIMSSISLRSYRLFYCVTAFSRMCLYSTCVYYSIYDERGTTLRDSFLYYPGYFRRKSLSLSSPVVNEINENACSEMFRKF